MTVTAVTVLLFIAACPLLSQGQDSGLKLQHVEVMFRHGDRTPVVYPPSMTTLLEKYWPDSTHPGLLTAKGIVDEYELGLWVNKKVEGLIGENYLVQMYRLRAVYGERTIMSGEAFSAGLYANNFSPLKFAGYKWAPTPVFSVPNQYDYILGSPQCPRNTDLQNAALQTANILQYTQEKAAMFKVLNTNSGYDFTINQTNLWMMEDPINCLYLHNFDKPTWATPEIYEEMKQAFAVYWFAEFSPKPIVKLSFGVYLNELVSRLQNVVANCTGADAPAKLLGFAAHDYQVSFFLSTLGLMTQPQIVPYSAAVMLELWGPAGATQLSQFYIQVMYKNGSSDTAYTYSTLPFCAGANSNGCPLNEFMDYLQNGWTLPKSEYNSACDLPPVPMTTTSTSGGDDTSVNQMLPAIIAGSIALVVIVITIIVVCCLACKMRGRRLNYT